MSKVVSKWLYAWLYVDIKKPKKDCHVISTPYAAQKTPGGDQYAKYLYSWIGTYLDGYLFERLVHSPYLQSPFPLDSPVLDVSFNRITSRQHRGNFAKCGHAWSVSVGGSPS